MIRDSLPTGGSALVLRLIPVMRGVFITGFGPRVANELKEISGSIPQVIWTAPWEDIQVKDS